MATARLIYETSENLDARTSAHRPGFGSLITLAASADAIATSSEHGVAVHGLDCELIWTDPEAREVSSLEFVGSDLVGIGHEVAFVWSADGTRRAHIATDVIVDRFAVDAAARRLVVVDGDARVVVFDLATGERVQEWSMDEDYDFGRRGKDIDGVLLLGERLVIPVGKEITVWVDGELDDLVYREGRHISTWGSPSWLASGNVAAEVSSDERGLVTYDDQMTMLGQYPFVAHWVRFCGDRLVGWTDQFIGVCDPRTGAATYRATDWRGHQHLQITADGRHAVSVSLGGELCVQSVDALAPLEGEPEILWVSNNVQSFDVDAAASRACVLRVEGDGHTLDVVDLGTGVPRSLPAADFAVERVQFIDDSRVLGTENTWADPGHVTLWNLADGSVEAFELEGSICVFGGSWAVTRAGEALLRYSFEGGKPTVVKRYTLPEGWEISSVSDARFIAVSDPEGEERVYDLETGAHFASSEGQCGGRFWVAEEWDDNYDSQYVVRDLSTGDDVGCWVPDSVDTVIVAKSRDQIFATTYEGDLFVWEPPAEPTEFFSTEEDDYAQVSLSRDERHLLRQDSALVVFDATAPGEPLVTVTAPFGVVSAEIANGHLMAAGNHGMYAVWAVEEP